jgi:hypothetical protein
MRLGLYVRGGAVAVAGALAAVGSALTGAGPAAGAPPAESPSGLFLVIEARVSPPVASRAGAPRGVAFTFRDLAGNDLTGLVPSQRRARVVDIRLARGMRVNDREYPSCNYRRLAHDGPPGCPSRAQVGAGSVLIDFRPVVTNFFRASCSAFNGRGPKHERALLLWCKTTFGASGTQWYDIGPPTRGFGPRFRSDSGPGAQGVAQDFVGADLTFPDKSIVVHGRRVAFLDAPASCTGSWLFEQVNTDYSGKRRVATDREPCVKRPG